jgi:(p)ppGpp synthase/HD superfamily hydrolase
MSDPKADPGNLVLSAMRLAEYAHRNRARGPHHRKAPPGEDRPPYFIHLAEVAWMLQDAGLDAETVAAGYLHDVIEDCGYSERQLAREIGSERVGQLVAWVSEPKRQGRSTVEVSWEHRSEAYLTQMREAPREALALSCADKTSNIRDMCRFLAKGHPTHTFLSRTYPLQLQKFEALAAVYRGRVPRRLYRRFLGALAEFRDYAHVG